MSLDLTNGDRLDVSPIVERKSNLVTLTSTTKPLSTNLTVKPVSQPIAVAPTLSIPTPSLAQSVQPTQTIGATTMIPRRINIAQAVTPRTLVQTAQPASTGIIPRTVSPQVAAQQLAAETGTTPSGTSIPRVASPQAQAGSPAPSGSGSGSAPAESTEETTEEGAKTAGEKTEIPASTTSQEKKKGMLWLVGLVVGGIGGYFMAKNQNKNLLTYSLIGAGVGGGVGFLADKQMGKSALKGTGSTGSISNSNEELANKILDNTKLVMTSLLTSLGQSTEQMNKEIEKSLNDLKPLLLENLPKLLSENEKKALSEYIDFENNFIKEKKDFEKDAPQLENKKNQINKKYSVNIDEIKKKLQPK